MFGFLKKERGAAGKKSNSRPRQKTVQKMAPSISVHTASDQSYDLIKKISDLQDQISRHDSRIHDKISEHHDFMENQHHEPMKKVAIEIMNKLYTQPAPVREEIVKLIKTDEDILSVIGDNRLSAGQVAERIGVTREHISRRMSNLTKAGLLTRVNDGRYVFYVKSNNE